MGTRMLQRRGTAAEWAAANPVLGDGELGYERDTGLFKFGDGATAWNDLPVDYIRRSLIDADGDLLVGAGPDEVTRLAKGAPGQRLTVAGDGTLVWETPIDPVPISVIDAAGDLIVGTGADAVDRLPRGTTGQRLYVKADGTLGWDTDRGLTPVTSSSRPSTPFAGQAIYETDTKKIYVWNGTAWQQVPIDETPGNFLKSVTKAGKRVHWNTFAQTTSTVSGQSGSLLITHGAAFTPTAVDVNFSGPVGGGFIPIAAVCDSLTATTFRARVMGSASGSVTATDGNAVTGYYWCYE